MNFTFNKLTSNPNLFFDILPSDWQDEIVPYWEGYKDFASIFVIVEKERIIGGGIVFSTCPPDIQYYKTEAQHWFDKGYLYLGFIWVAEDRRNKNLGTFWLEQLKKTYPDQNYWLLIEEDHLHRFYQKNEFVLINTIIHENHTEWLYSYTPL